MRLRDIKARLQRDIAALAAKFVATIPRITQQEANERARRQLDPASFVRRRRNNGPNHKHPKSTARRKAALKAKQRRLRA